MGASPIFKTRLEADFKPDLLEFGIRIKAGFVKKSRFIMDFFFKSSFNPTIKVGLKPVLSRTHNFQKKYLNQKIKKNYFYFISNFLIQIIFQTFNFSIIHYFFENKQKLENNNNTAATTFHLKVI